jgi:hypothetical protein
MANTYKATNAFSNEWAKAEEKFRDAVKKEDKLNVPVWIHELQSADKALEGIKVDDVADYTIDEWKRPSPTEMGNFSPDALQGYHGIILEKSIKVRYKESVGLNVAGVYKKAAESMDQMSNYMKGFKDISKM